MDWLPNASSFYRLLLLAYPAEFRNEYGEQMEEVFAGRMASEPSARVWLQTVADLFYTAPREHLSVVWSDLRYATKILAKAPGFTVVALLTIALGIGSTTAVFSVMNAVLLKSLPYTEPERLAYIRVTGPLLKLPSGMELAPSAPEFYDLRKTSQSFSRLAMFSGQPFTMALGDGSRQIGGAQVTGDFFATLGAIPEIGRRIDANDDEPGHEAVAVLGYSLWQREFGGDADAIGKFIRLNRRQYRVIGVMRPGFAYPHYTEAPEAADTRPTEVWTPAALTGDDRNSRDSIWGDVIGRLRPGVSLKNAQAEVRTRIANSARLQPVLFQGAQTFVKSFLDAAIGAVRPLVWLLMSAVFLVLLIACSNVANLLLSRGSARINEIGLRAALGAERARLVRQFLTESVALSVFGGALGVLLAGGAIRLLLMLNPGNIPRLEETSVNWPVLAFALAVSLFSGILFGLYPALSWSRYSLTDLLKRSGNKGMVGSSKRVRNALVVVEIGLAVVLLAASGLLIRSFAKIENLNAGFSQAAITARIELDDRYTSQTAWREFFRWTIDKVHSLPGIRRAGLVSVLPLSDTGSITTFDVKGYMNDQKQSVDITSVTFDYFYAMHIQLLHGRLLNDSDDSGRSLVTVVSDSFAKKYFAGRSPLGGRVYLSGGAGTRPFLTIVGVVNDVRSYNLEEAPRPLIYQSFWQSPQRTAFVVWETDAEPLQTAEAIRKIVRSRDGEIALSDIRSMAQRESKFEAGRRYQTVLLGSFAAAALVLALVGLYGLMSYSVRQRSAEIGVRMALGATRLQILDMVMKQGLALTSIGLTLGLIGALGVTRFLSAMLFDTSVLDPATFVLVPCLFLIVAAAACWIPSWQATKTDPVQALRDQ